jgi:hypothetical protein
MGKLYKHNEAASKAAFISSVDHTQQRTMVVMPQGHSAYPFTIHLGGWLPDNYKKPKYRHKAASMCNYGSNPVVMSRQLTNTSSGQ